MLWQLDPVADQQGDVAGEEAGDDAAEEAGLQVHGEHAADESGCESRPVGDGVGDVAGEDGDHQLEGRAAADVHQRRRDRALLLEGFDAEDEGQGDAEPARDHDRQHVGDAGQQVFVGAFHFSARGFLGGRFRRGRAAGDGRPGLGLGDDVRRALDRRADRGRVERLAGEARGVDVGVRRDDDQVRRRDLFVRELVLGADRALGLDADAVARRRCGLLERVRRHEGVGDAGRAGGDGDDAPAAGLSCCLNRCRLGRDRWRRRRQTRHQRQQFPEHRLGLADGASGRDREHRFIAEGLGLDVDVGGDQHRVGGGDGCVREAVLGALGAVDLDLHRRDP